MLYDVFLSHTHEIVILEAWSASVGGAVARLRCVSGVNDREAEDFLEVVEVPVVMEQGVTTNDAAGGDPAVDRGADRPTPGAHCWHG